MLNTRGAVIWLTGLPCSGKTLLAKLLSQQLKMKGLSVVHLDGDCVRQNWPDLGFSTEDRAENIRRVSEMARHHEQLGSFVIASFISPFESHRAQVKSRCARFVEVYLCTPLSICEQRDVKGQYAQARRGEIKDFTGVSHPYEAPTQPDLIIDTSRQSPPTCLDKLLALVESL